MENLICGKDEIVLQKKRKGDPYYLGGKSASQISSLAVAEDIRTEKSVVLGSCLLYIASRRWVSYLIRQSHEVRADLRRQIPYIGPASGIL